ncbi:MAG: hypothetical protein COV46_07530 [Deltaproteobacteria bacterium CG11_big_fil_rev_8_21_14_0_20_49_13]|nr:MAG: hypothetical protein COV46_07530 [Deltaproteobacteria bacterium CG11_big_fil_rev_8_21_14_0_20_49_13]
MDIWNGIWGLLPIGFIFTVICKTGKKKKEEKEPEKIAITPKKELPRKNLYEDEGSPWIHGEW